MFTINTNKTLNIFLLMSILFFLFSCATSPSKADISSNAASPSKTDPSSSAAQRARDAANKGFMEEIGEGIGIPEIPESLPSGSTKSSQYDEPEIIIAQNINTSTKQPSWVKNSQNAYPASRYLSAVGSGRSTGDAENAAIASIARIIKQNVSSTIKTREIDSVSSSGSSFNQSTLDEIIETYSVVDALVGVKIGQFWWDKNDIVYAVAYVDKQEASQYYSKKMNENEALIMEKIAAADRLQGQFISFNSALQALFLAEENEQYLDILHAMDANAARAKNFRYGSLASIKDLSYSIAQKIAIDISVVGDDEGRIATSLSTMLAKYGFKTRIGNLGASYLLDAAVSFVEVPAERNYFLRFIFSANLIEKSKGTIVLPYSANKREGHISIEGAKERAVQSLLNTIQNEYANFFVEFLRE